MSTLSKFAAALTLAAGTIALPLAAQARGPEVGVSIHIGQPGLSGQIDIGRVPPQTVAYPYPAYPAYPVYQPPPRVVYPPPVVVRPPVVIQPVPVYRNYPPPYHAHDGRYHDGRYWKHRHHKHWRDRLWHDKAERYWDRRDRRDDGYRHRDRDD